MADEKLSGWLFLYLRSTPGVSSAANATVNLGEYGEHQPDKQLRIDAALGGRSWIDEEGHVEGPPELIVEVSRSSRDFDLGEKKLDYERAGVLEYVVVALDPDEVYWIVLDGGRLVVHPPGPDGLFRSRSFPGLWLDPTALYTEDLNALSAAVERGLAAPEHAEFVARLAASRDG